MNLYLFLIVMAFNPAKTFSRTPWKQGNFLAAYRTRSYIPSTDPDESWLEQKCDQFDRELTHNAGTNGYTTGGHLCISIHGTLQFLTWCPNDYYNVPGADESVVMASLDVHIVDIRPSYLSTCRLYDITITAGSYWDWPYSCNILLINGLLVCAKHEDVIPEFQLLTIFPTINNDQTISYKICGTTGGTRCPIPAKIPSLLQPEEEFENFGFVHDVP